MQEYPSMDWKLHNPDSRKNEIMQLTKIKLAGFKSFVDPTSVLLPSNLVAVVGPNGCGKSNIIDAITWVMGESSAKYLRGESLTDVIFNGSSARKPVGLASVELCFDNQDGTLGGEYSNYAEISIRRQITRSGDSTYFLNGSRCRRRDVIDIFLGTGLGPRSYSIIGQNMISRIIEAKPDEMRVYLEEAAGISKYKERRRETENRINHTKENLARLDDLRLELEKQLGSLKRQASSAERFKVLKQEERLQRGQWYAVQWRQLDGRLVQYTLQIQQQETGLEARHADMSSIDLGLERKREEHHLATEAFSEVQRRFYVAGNDITRMEQEIRHHQERQRQRQTDLAEVNKDWEQADEQQQEIQDQLEELATEIITLEPEAEAATDAATTAAQELTAAFEAVQHWQGNWDTFNQVTAKATQAAQVEQTRIQHLEQKITASQQRELKLTEEKAQFKFDDLEKEMAEVSDQASAAVETAEAREHELKQIHEKISTLQTTQQTTTSRLDQVRNSLQKLRGRQSSLDALQQTALGQRNNHQMEWLSQYDLDKKPRLAQSIEVQAGWENAVEKVLSVYLQAICVDDLNSIATQAVELKKGNLCIFAGGTNAPTTTPAATTLLSKVNSKWPLESLLADIYVADTLAQALELSSSLPPQASVITPDGTWLSANWMLVSREEDPAAGVFQREQELKQLATEIATHEATQVTIEAEIKNLREQLTELSQTREQLQKTVNQARGQVAELQAREKMRRERFSDLAKRAERIGNELSECTHQISQAQEELHVARANWQTAMTHLEQQAEQRTALTTEREQSQQKLQSARNVVNQTKDRASELQIRLQTSKSQQASLKQTVNHMQTQLTSLAQRKKHLEDELSAAAPIDDLEKTLTIALEHRLTIENELTDARSTTEIIEHEIRSLENNRQALEREMSKLRDVLETLRLECQSLRVKSESLLEQVNEVGLQLNEILQDIPETIDADTVYAQLEQTLQRINRLGPINLVAIEEYATCSERKEYLDKQNADLQEGLATLESAIAKIDKETRARFRETYDKVNTRFQELFPHVFGGGKAYLEMTGENLLDAGITVMACPPGKRNSTIHLLSGGEKALTAIALVFSIFHLNPAPFCLLDEVDAPLDDANVVRFCNLVKTMAEKTQFIFISHNKLAIEMAKHLMGVTMHEPGVSRLVSVNVEEAISLAGA
jgi:chromosome segregation protein